MAVRLSHVCDNVLVHGEDEVEGTVQEVSVGRLAGLLDLCEPCRSSLVEPLRQLLVEHGRTENGKAVRAAAAKRGLPRTSVASLPDGMTVDEAQARLDEGKCPLDPACAPLKDRAAAGAHVRNYHGIKGGLDSLGLGKRGRDTTRTGATGEYVCNECDPPREFESPQGFGAHKARVHPKGKKPAKRARARA